MKKFGFLAVMALLMMFGCSKDEVITDEQELFSVEKNNQPVIGKKGGLDTSRWKPIYFYLTSSKGDSYVSFNPLDPPHEINNLKILNSGYFYGVMMNFGKIDPSPSMSYFDFSSCKIVEDTRPEWGGEYMFDLEILNAKVSLSANDYFYIDINVFMRPWFDSPYGFVSGRLDNIEGEGFAITYGGEGKFKEIFDNQSFRVTGISKDINLDTGEITLLFRLYL